MNAGPPAHPTEQTRAAAGESELPAETRIWLIRHGETQWSKSGQHTGLTDVELTEHGVEQAVALRSVLRDERPGLVLSSPLGRARRTAELADVSVDAIDPDLGEWDYGEYEGLTTPQIRERDPDWTVWTGRVPGGETLAQVGARADRLLARIRSALGAGPVILFGHGHINRVLAARWLGLPVEAGRFFTLGTAAPCVLGVEHAGPVIVQWNIPNLAAQ